MKEIQAIERVTEFHKKFDNPINLTPTLPNRRLAVLRVNLIQEELDELNTAILNKDIVEIADALSDLQYVLTGTYIAFGLQNIAHELFEEVHRSNMSKLCKTKEEAEETQKYYASKRKMETYLIPRGTEFEVRKVSDDKTLKSVNYSPCNLKPIIEKSMVSAGITKTR